jgi:hypothetical protein
LLFDNNASDARDHAANERSRSICPTEGRAYAEAGQLSFHG